jgi:Fructosamine kinase
MTRTLFPQDRSRVAILGRTTVSPLFLTQRRFTDTAKQSKRSDRLTIGFNTNERAFRSLAIARMFGGIPKTFFATYEKCRLKTEPSDEYHLRGDLYELFHYLNHTLLFGVSFKLCKQPVLNVISRDIMQERLRRKLMDCSKHVKI